MDQVILKPIITEKSLNEAGRGQFTFEVMRFATKPMIKKAIEGQFNVNVLSLQTTFISGKRRRVGRRRQEHQESSWKKAIVKLKGGQRIELFEAGRESK